MGGGSGGEEAPPGTFSGLCFPLVANLRTAAWYPNHPPCGSVAQPCPTLCNPTDCSTPGFPVPHQLPALAQTHVHWSGDAIQPSRLLLSPSLLPSIFPPPTGPDGPILTITRGLGCPVSGGHGHRGRQRAGVGVSGTPRQGSHGDRAQGAGRGGDGVL